jgi:putative tricarboxylic transport membrane protein
MKRRDQWSSLFWLVFAGLVGVASVRMGIGTFQVPGPGLLPLMAALFVASLALLLLIKSTLKKGTEDRIVELRTGATSKGVVLVSFSLLVYAVLLTRLGFLIATFGLMTLLYSVLGRSRLWVRAVAALVTVLAAHLVFRIWLEVDLPKGILGI